jgi:hypothetical protein
MADLVVIVPSRGRPQAARELVDAFAETCVAKTKLLFAVDETDPSSYNVTNLLSYIHHVVVNVVICPSKSMGEALHMAAVNVCLPESWSPSPENFPPPFAVGFMGDDHRPRTKGWDQRYLDALREMGTGIVYGNDLLQGGRIPTQVAMTSDIVRALGYMAPPTLRHLYVDNFWKDLGTAADCIRYLPDVIVEHMHPVAGKAQWDESYKRVNAPAMYEHDARAYAEYRRDFFADDVAKVVALRGVAAV